MDFSQLALSRRSIRRYTSDSISGDDVESILSAALMSPTSMNRRSWHFVVVEQALDLEKLSDAKERGAQFLREAALAVVVLGDAQFNDCWVEDGSIAAVTMQYQAADRGIGSCWVQIKGRYLPDGTSAETVVRGILDIPEQYSVLCILGFGHPAEQKPQHDAESLKWQNVHVDRFGSDT